MRLLAGQSGGSEPVNIQSDDLGWCREAVAIEQCPEPVQDRSRRRTAELLVNDGMGEQCWSNRTAVLTAKEIWFAIYCSEFAYGQKKENDQVDSSSRNRYS